MIMLQANSTNSIATFDDETPLERLRHNNRLPITMVGRVESVMTRYEADGGHHRILLLLADGGLLRGKWRAEPMGLLPRLGDIIRVELGEPSGMADHLPQLLTGKHPATADKPCHWISNWRTLPLDCPLEILAMLYRATPQPEALDRFWKVIAQITIPCLQTWLTELFAQRQFGLPFVQVAASQSHHHSEVGGLLLHSVECAEWVEIMANATINAKETALSITAALLHDFGKVATMGNSSHRMVNHEILTLTLLEPALLDLQKQWPQGAFALRYMLSWLANPRKFPKLPGALLVKAADQYSAALSARDKAFQQMPQHYYWASLKTPYSVQFFHRVN